MTNRNYKPMRLADSFKDINKSLTNKFGKIEYLIYSKWSEIVGKFFFQHSRPAKINIIKKPDLINENEFQEKILHVNVAPAAAVEFQHFENKILEKINSFFGYQAIHRIKIQQNFVSKNTYKFSKTNNKYDNDLLIQKKSEIKDTIQKINDKELEQSLLNLGLSIARNEEN